MTSDSANGGYRLTAWVVGGSALVAVALVAAAIVWSWHLKIVASGLQLLGIGLTLLGVAVVRSWLERAADMTAEAKRGLDRLWAQSRERLRVWWSRRRGRPVVVHVTASDSVTVTDSATATVTRYRVDRQTVADRDWLVHLDDRVYGLVEQVDKLEQARNPSRLSGGDGSPTSETRCETRCGRHAARLGAHCRRSRLVGGRNGPVEAA